MSDKKSFKFQGYFLLLDLFKDSQVNSLHPQSKQAGDSSLARKYIDENICKILQFSSS